MRGIELHKKIAAVNGRGNLVSETIVQQLILAFTVDEKLIDLLEEEVNLLKREIRSGLLDVDLSIFGETDSEEVDLMKPKQLLELMDELIHNLKEQVDGLGEADRQLIIRAIKTLSGETEE